MPDELPVDSPLRIVPADIAAEVSIETLGQWHDNLQLQYAFPICGFPHRDPKKQIVICTNRAGLNTTHLDEGRCFRHEIPEQIIRSTYARQLVGFSSLQEIFEEVSARQKGIKDLSDEITMARTVLAHNISQLKQGQFGKNDALFSTILKTLEQIRKLAESIAGIEEREARGLTMESISGFLWHLHRILDEELLNPEGKARIFDRIATECMFVHPKQT